MDILQIDPIAGLVSLIALVFSIFAAYKSVSNEKYKQNRADYVVIETSFVQLEMSLKDRPGALKFHNVNIEDINKIGISIEEFSYLLANFTLGGIDYREKLITDDKPELTNYRIKMLHSQDTRNAWHMLKKMMSDTLYTDLIEEEIKKINEIELLKNSEQTKISSEPIEEEYNS